MTAGLSAVNLANGWLNTLRNVAFTELTNVYIQLHKGDPGASGTSNVSSVTTRPEVTFAAASAGSMAKNNTPSWSNWAGDDEEEVTHISLWDAATDGTFRLSIQLGTPKIMQTGDTLNLTSLTIALQPIAA